MPGASKEKSEDDKNGAKDISAMTEEEYIEYCRKYSQQMGMPFDEAMVRNHYKQMKEEKQNGGHGGVDADGSKVQGVE